MGRRVCSLQKEQLAGIPVLVLGNKNDLPNALEVETLIELLGLKDILEREVCCYSISCKNQVNIGTPGSPLTRGSSGLTLCAGRRFCADITLDWLKKHRKGAK